VNLKVEEKSAELKPQFSQVERDLNLQKMFKPIPIPQKSTKEKNNYGIMRLCVSIVCNKSKKKKEEQTIRKIINFIY
jgi:hypothetical protein